jgi:proton glutamate symport protein
MKMRKIALHWQILLAILLGIIVGLTMPSVSKWIDWVGILFLKALKMIVLPLIVTSIISGIVDIKSSNNFRILGFKVIFYYLTTSLIAIFTGLVLVNLFQPGEGADLIISSDQPLTVNNNLGLKDILMGIIPSNVFDSMAKGDILPVIFFSLILGFFITRVHTEQGEILSGFFKACYEVMMKITLWIVRFAPIGIFAIIIAQIAENKGRIAEVAGNLGLYMLVVILGLIIHGLITLPLIVFLIGRVKPYLHLKNMFSALLTAFSTSSSSATLPLTLESTINKSGVSNHIAGFTLPLGATINMDGTALYECVAAIFIAQAYGIDLSIAQQLIIVLTALLASIGAAGIPMAGLVMLTIILSAVNLPIEGIGLIIAVDRILDMLRTTVNVWSDSCGAVIIARTEKEKLNL